MRMEVFCPEFWVEIEMDDASLEDKFFADRFRHHPTTNALKFPTV